MEQSSPRKTFVITGATSGIGLAVAQQLLQHSHSVIGIGRSDERCRQQQASLRAYSSSGARLSMLTADLSLQSEILRLVPEIRRMLDDWGSPHLDCLINNAGAVPFWQTFTPEGFDLQWALNHLAPFLLTNELLPLLKCAPAGRVITVSSGSHYHKKLNWEDIQLRHHYNALRAYGQTKLANVLFTVELDRRLRTDSNVRAFAADPGLVNTEIGLKSNSFLARWAWDVRRRGGITPAESARGIVFLATEPSIQSVPDLYWKHGKPKAADPNGLNPEAASHLWKLSARMCGLEAAREPAYG
jgi:NAD(P)-dependent dehydrogenase (short-subunit alcohol dehydrogenase family)